MGTFLDTYNAMASSPTIHWLSAFPKLAAACHSHLLMGTSPLLLILILSAAPSLAESGSLFNSLASRDDCLNPSSFSKSKNNRDEVGQEQSPLRLPSNCSVALDRPFNHSPPQTHLFNEY